MPFSRLLPRTQKTSLIVAIGAITVLLAVVAFQTFYFSQSPVVQNVNYTELRALVTGDAAVRSLLVEGELLVVEKTDGTRAQAVVTNAVAQQEIISVFEQKKLPVVFNTMQPGRLSTALNWLITLLTLGVIAFVGWRLYASMSGGHGDFELNDANSGGQQTTTFADVAGVDEAKNELAETIEFLRDPLRFGRLGGRAPRGILLSGSPGTGKTLLARAAATEANVPFLSVSGSSFQEKFAGLGAARVRRLFKQARKLAPCVVFIDEIDALGRRRGRSGDSASADQDQTLNQLLIEMDGFKQLEGVVVIASTNRPDILDSALTRPGRFDREIAVNLADARGREEILRVHARKLTLATELELGWIARGTPGFSGADLANLLNEAAIVATRHNADSICREHVEYARDKILMGAERHGFMMDEEERYATAVHEAGHVAVGLDVKHGDPIHKVSILPRGRALGVTQSLPERDRLMKKREYLEDQIALLLGGRAAEQILLETMTAGASNDIERAVEIARKMVSEFGMSPLGPIHLGKPEDPHSQSLLDRVEHATNDIINAQMARACEIVGARREEIMRLTAGLMERDTLESDEIQECFGIKAASRAA
ncbi:MAG TPA: ATP-dependent zinc metalloprotease FtsH [Pyrinomonadaceae bacterium]|jgi:cell division protease FtsH|nr:ATP-dependent zinc metalloprotease FtsH [Pyrinomonadaceae bacterium]